MQDLIILQYKGLQHIFWDWISHWNDLLKSFIRYMSFITLFKTHRWLPIAG